MSSYRRKMDQLRLGEEKKAELKNLYRQSQQEADANRRMGMRPMKKYVRPAVAIAACAAILCGFVVQGNVSVHRQLQQPTAAYKGAGQKEDRKQQEHAFTLLVNAQELSGDKVVVVPNDVDTVGAAEDQNVDILPENGDVSIYSGDQDSREISFHFGTKLRVEGEQIASVRYNIENAKFLQWNSTNEWMDLNDESQWKDSYTINYEDQAKEDKSLYIVGKKQISEEAFAGIFPEEHGSHYSGEAERNAQNELVKDIRITCTVTFQDGSTKEQQIVMESKLFTQSELDELFVTDKRELRVTPEKEDQLARITFRLK